MKRYCSPTTWVISPALKTGSPLRGHSLTSASRHTQGTLDWQLLDNQVVAGAGIEPATQGFSVLPAITTLAFVCRYSACRKKRLTDRLTYFGNVRQSEPMKANAQRQPMATAENVIPFTASPPPRPRAHRQRFKIQAFTNPRTGSQSWRVTGIKARRLASPGEFQRDRGGAVPPSGTGNGMARPPDRYRQSGPRN